jgi:hypothetical protein
MKDWLSGIESQWSDFGLGEDNDKPKSGIISCDDGSEEGRVLSDDDDDGREIDSNLSGDDDDSEEDSSLSDDDDKVYERSNIPSDKDGGSQGHRIRSYVLDGSEKYDDTSSEGGGPEESDDVLVRKGRLNGLDSSSLNSQVRSPIPRQVSGPYDDQSNQLIPFVSSSEPGRKRESVRRGRRSGWNCKIHRMHVTGIDHELPC